MEEERIARDARRVLHFLDERGQRRRPGTLEAILGWARKYSLTPYPLVTGCCLPELEAAMGPRYDMEQYGCAVPAASPRHADLLILGGTLTRRQVPVLERIRQQLVEPYWVMAFGACACSGGPYSNYAVSSGFDSVIPVDVYVPGCPPRPEALFDGLTKLQARIQAERRVDRRSSLESTGGGTPSKGQPGPQSSWRGPRIQSG
ncbi:NADH-quinone oxidoreductase subunit NuoB [Myxococcota bacterium]|nr:NADH-quinone oxidoreductase subunit NuoB [Myxococcota bacterium]